MRLKKVSEEVYLTDEPIVKIGSDEIDLLKKAVLTSPRGRVRICAHRDSSNLLHEMIIALRQDTYVRPHKHTDKCESFHIIEGAVDVIALNEDGTIREIIELGALGTDRQFFYRLADPVYHTLLIRSEVLVIHETTQGPFKKGDAIFAPWAPEETNPTAAQIYMAELSKSVAKFLQKH